MRREDTPSTRVSMESVAAIWSGRTFVHTATSISVASAGVNGMSSGRGPPVAGAAVKAPSSVGADAAEVTEAGSGAAGALSAGAASSASSASVDTSRTTSSVANTTPRSRSTFNTSMSTSAYCGRVRVWPIMFAIVGAEPTPTSTKRSTPRVVSAKSWVSIQRTGEANCQAKSSIRIVRASFCSFLAAASKSARISSSSGEDTTSSMDSTNSRVSSKGRATRFGM